MQLASIFAYQSAAATNANALASTYQLSYETAAQNIKSSGNMTLNVLGILSYIWLFPVSTKALFSARWRDLSAQCFRRAVRAWSQGR